MLKINASQTRGDESNAAQCGSQGREYLNKRQVARLLGLSVRTIESLMSRGILPYLKLSERCIRFYHDDITAAMAALKVGGGR